MTKVNVGTIGLVDHGKTTVAAALMLALASNPVVNAKPIHYITAHPPCDPIDCRAWNTKKSKGNKHRDRAERRRKWGI